jgi:peptidoglycan biosynthesis protein MviN/MurJ (putative lipid II flippase)
MPQRPTPASTQRRDAFLTAASQVAGMGLGAVLALLVLALYGKNARTDGFFAAYGVFAFLSSVAQGFRVSLPALLIDSDQKEQPPNRFFGAVLALSGLASIPMVFLGQPVAALLVGSLGGTAVTAATQALLLLWFAGTLQLLAGLFAAILGVQGRFVDAAVAYVTGAMTSILLTVVLSGPLGITAVSVGMLGGGLLTSSLLAYRVIREGWRPTLHRGTALAARRILSGSAGYIALQMNYLITLAFAARLGEGTVTLYAYAFFAALLLVGATSGPASIVLAGPLAQTWDRRTDSLQSQLLSVTRAGLLLAMPAMAIAVLLGDDILRALLPSALSATDAHRLGTTLLALTGFVVLSIAGTVPVIAAFAQGRHAGVARAALLTFAAHLTLSSVAAQSDRLELLALATSAGQVLFLLAVLGTVYGSAFRQPVWLLVKAGSALIGLASVSFGTSALMGIALGGGVWQIAALSLGVITFFVLVRLTSPASWAILLALLSRAQAPRTHEN